MWCYAVLYIGRTGERASSWQHRLGLKPHSPRLDSTCEVGLLLVLLFPWFLPEADGSSLSLAGNYINNYKLFNKSIRSYPIRFNALHCTTRCRLHRQTGFGINYYSPFYWSLFGMAQVSAKTLALMRQINYRFHRWVAVQLAASSSCHLLHQERLL